MGSVAMNEIKHTAVALKMVTEGPGWHGPSVQQILKDVTAQEALARPATGGACIWEIVLHMRRWQQEALHGLEGGRVRMDLTREEDWPAIEDRSEGAWEVLKSGVEHAHRELRERVKRLTPAELDNRVDADREYPLYALVHGIVAHEAYHGGQLGLIKSSLRRKEQARTGPAR